MKDSDKLNYYLKNASTHATIIVAVVFGLFSILNLICNIEKSNETIYLISNITLNSIYFALAFFGCYTIDRWRFYKTKAKDIVGAKDHAWKNECWMEFIDWLFEKAIFFFFTVCFSAWGAVALFLFPDATIPLLGMLIFYVIIGIVIWRFTKTSNTK